MATSNLRCAIVDPPLSMRSHAKNVENEFSTK
jgi:hypothetical protein